MPSKPWGLWASKCTTTAITQMPLPCFRAAPHATAWWPLAARTTMAVRRVPYWARSHRGMLCLSMFYLTCNGPMLPQCRGENADLGAQDIDQPGDLYDRWGSNSMIHGRPPQTICLYNHLISRDDADQRQLNPCEKLAHCLCVL